MTDTILIVDDSSYIAEGLVAILKKSYHTLVALGGQQCLDILKKEKPSIIILDILMEPMDGWETLARIKENPDTRHIPVLMFSAKKISAKEAEEHRVNIDDIVSKPVTPKKLIEAIEKVLGRQKANRRNIEVWRSAGIGQDRIDEYTSLMTMMEVDVSLVQNMKVQLSLLHEGEKSYTELESLIAAIGNRIQEELRHEEELSREMQKSLAKDAKEKDRAGPAPAMRTGNNEMPSAENETKAETKKVPIFFPNIPNGKQNLNSLEIPGSDVNVQATSPAVKPEHNQKPPISSFPEECSPVQSSMQPLTVKTASGKSETDKIIISDDKAPPVIEQKVADQKYPAAREPRPLTTRTLDNKPISPDAPLPPAAGSGTDTSFGRKQYSVDKTPEINRVIRKNTLPEQDISQPPQGFISRIISTILKIFKRK